MTVTLFGVLSSVIVLTHIADGLNIRLVNGSRPSEGRLEVFYNNAWGTVCDEDFDTSAARVVCRMLEFNGNLTTAAAKNGATYGQGTGQILLDDVRCNGTESSLSYCRANWGTHNCVHSEDAGVDCVEGFNIRLVNGSRPSRGRLEVFYNNTWGTVCDDGFNSSAAIVACRMLGFTGNVLETVLLSSATYVQGTGQIWLDDVKCNGTESSLFNCQANSWGVEDCGLSEDVGVDCNFSLNIRLVNGSRPSEGRLEVFYNNAWGTVCDDGFDTSAAKVVCRMLGFTGNVFAPAALNSTTYGQGAGQIWLDDVKCNGTESSLSLCRTTNWGEHNCGHSDDVGVDCNSTSGFNIRLVNGSRPSQGRLEVFYNNIWGTVCDDGFNSSAAIVVCRMLGFTGNVFAPAALNSTTYGQGAGQIWLDDVKCNGTESSLSLCRTTNWGEHNCGHSDDVGVDCNSTSGFNIRLVNGSRPSQGRLEVFYNNIWGTVCDHGFNNSTAIVVCRMLGFSGNGFAPAALNSTTYGQGTGQIWLDDLKCNGTESSLSYCRTKNWGEHNCGHSEDVGVDCNCPLGSYSVSCSKQCHCRLGPCDGVTGTCENGGCKVGWTGIACNETTSIRLINGYRPSQGRLEVFYNNTWGTVCDDGFNSSAAIVVCRMLGFSGNGFAPAALNSTTYGQGTGPIWLDDVRCNGTESSLSYCRTTHWGEHNCGHGKDVGVDCNCPQGTYSENCSKQCNCLVGPCDSVTGACGNSICKDGWKGAACNENCPLGSYSVNCSKECHCRVNPCDSVTGACANGCCKDGWKGIACNENCPLGNYSVNCSKQCHCRLGPCDGVTGACGNGGCKDGWTGKACSEKCGGVLTDPIGVITSPNFPNDYNNNTRCTWIIKAPEGSQINLNFTDFVMESHEQCRLDHLELFNGPNAFSLWIGKYCGTEPPVGFKSQSNSVCIFFFTDSVSSSRGFNLTYTFSVQDCPLGSYSENCSQQCRCLVGPCDSVTGACGNGVCEDGWKGIACNETKEDTMPLETIVWTAVSSVIGVVMIVGVTVIACVCHERKKKKMAPNAVELNELQSSNSPQGLPDDNMYDAIGPCEELVNDERKYDGQGQTKYSDGVLYENDY
ncbi:deleted in malignant brain tumors 1 protein-like [Dreissena polymorpha]|uniref:deleted in malignant brain tumors 1 protein-like n=1 Tax=Dreissena polymorpha TaxID=45954 RepID=UPI0022650B94|nr:deleted in malignant brain tumors 1 protein-like [Dreissena polymorpha]